MHFDLLIHPSVSLSTQRMSCLWSEIVQSGGSNIPVKDVNERPFATGMLSNQQLSLAVVFSVEWLSVFSTSSSLSFTEKQKPTGLQLCHHFGYRNSYILLNERGRIKMKGSGAENKVKLIHQKCIQLFIYFYLLVFILYTDIYGYKYTFVCVWVRSVNVM